MSLFEYDLENRDVEEVTKHFKKIIIDKNDHPHQIEAVPSGFPDEVEAEVPADVFRVEGVDHGVVEGPAEVGVLAIVHCAVLIRARVQIPKQ